MSTKTYINDELELAEHQREILCEYLVETSSEYYQVTELLRWGNTGFMDFTSKELVDRTLETLEIELVDIVNSQLGAEFKDLEFLPDNVKEIVTDYIANREIHNMLKEDVKDK